LWDKGTDPVATPLHANDPKKNNSDKILAKDENYKKVPFKNVTAGKFSSC